MPAILGRWAVILGQARFLPAGTTPKEALLDEAGFVYVPDACKVPAAGAGGALYAAHCRIHVHWHPCGGSWRPVSTSYMLQNALPAYSEGNEMVILYPQSISGAANPVGDSCFDWFGATGAAFDTRDGVQLKFVLKMMTDLRAPDVRL